jgi:hypothetical protein
MSSQLDPARRRENLKTIIISMHKIRLGEWFRTQPYRLSVRVGRTPWLAFFMGHVSISSSGASELGTASGAVALRGSSRLFALMAQQVTECRELPPIAAVFPALRLGSRVNDAWHRAIAALLTGRGKRYWSLSAGGVLVR